MVLLYIKRIFVSTVILVTPVAALAAAKPIKDIAYYKVSVAGVRANVVTANLNNQDIFVTPVISRRGIGSSESFRSIIRRTKPAAAINGTFFCTRTLRPTGDIVINGQLMYKGYLGTAITIDCNSQIQFIPTKHGGTYKWSDYSGVLAAGPSLILGGKTVVMPRSEGFRSGVHFCRRARAAVGLTYNKKLIFVTTHQQIYYRQLAKVMKRLKCTDAAVLDGGSSIGLYCQGRMINNPGRGMTNCLLIYNNRNEYEQHKELLYPANRTAQLSSRKSSKN